MCKAVDSNSHLDSNSVGHGSFPLPKSRFFLFFCAMLLSLAGSVFAAPEVSSMSLYDLNGNGEADRLEVVFSVPVDIVDSDGGDGIPGVYVVVEDPSAPPYIKHPRHLEIVPGTYGMSASNVLLLDLVEVGASDTGLSVFLEIKDELGETIFENSTGVPFAPGYTSMPSFDEMAPVLEEAFTVNPDSGELILVFSEPVVRAGGNLNLLIEDFVYNDASGGNVTSISAMGADTDGTDRIVTVLVNTMITSNDLNTDDINPLSSVTDMYGNPASSVPATFFHDMGNGAIVEVFVEDSSFGLEPAGSNLQFIATVELYSLEGGANFQSLPVTMFGATPSEIDMFQFFDNDGFPLTAPFTLFEGSPESITLDIPMGIYPEFINLAAAVYGVPMSSNITISFDSTNAQTDQGVNGGPGPEGVSIPVFEGNVGPALELELIDPMVMLPFEIWPGATNQEVLNFVLQPSETMELTSLSVGTNRPGAIAVARLAKWQGNILTNIATGSVVAGNIQFSGLAESLEGSSSYALRIDLAESAMSGNIEFFLSPENLGVAAGITFGAGIYNSLWIPELGPRDAAYGMTPPDGGIERIVVEYAYLQDYGFAFYTEVSGNVGGISSMTLTAPNGGTVSLMQEDMYRWEGEDPADDSFYASKLAMNGVYGAGTYSLSITHSDMSTETISFFANPDVVAASPEVLSPTAGSEVLVPFGIGWSTAATVDFFEVALEAPLNESRINEHFYTVAPDVNSFSMEDPLDAGLPYYLFVSGVKVQNVSVATTSQGDDVSVIVQSWNERIVQIVTGGGADPGAVLVEEDFGFTAPGTLADGSIGNPVLRFRLDTPPSGNSAFVHTLFFDVTRDDPMADVTQDISAANLMVYDDMGGFLGEFAGVVGSSNISFNSASISVSGSSVFVELVVDMTQFPLPGGMAIGLVPSNVIEMSGVGYGPGPIVRSYEIGSGGFTSGLVRELAYEVGPPILDTLSSANLNVVFNAKLGPGESGFDEIYLHAPDVFQSVSLNGIASASSNTALLGGFTPIPGGNYTVVPEPWGARVLLSSPVTSTNPDKYFLISLSVTTSDFEVTGQRFELSVRNSAQPDLPEYFGYSSADVNTNLINRRQDPASINIVSNIVDSGQNVTFAQAEVDTTPSLVPIADEATGITSNSSVSFKFAVMADIQPGDKGFDIVSIGSPSELNVDLGSIVVTEGDGTTPVTVLSANVQNERLRIRLSSAIETVGMNYIYVDVVATTGNLTDGIVLDVQLNNTTNPANPFPAFEGNAEESVETLLWNSLFVPIDTSALADLGPAVTSLRAELQSPNGYLDTGSSGESVTLNLLTTVENGESGYDQIVLELSPGFEFVGSLVVVNEAGNTLTVNTETLGSDPANGEPAKARVTFDSLQLSSNLQVFASVTTPEEEVDLYLGVKVFNSASAFSDVWASPFDVDSDGSGGQLLQRVVAPVLNVSNVSGEVIYEVEVANSANTEDLYVDSQVVSVDDVPVWRVFIKPEILAGDAGYNQVKISLPFELDSTLPSSVRVYSANATTVQDLNAWSANPLAEGEDSDYTLQEDDPYAVKVRLLSTRTISDEILVVTFRKKVTSYPSFMFARVELNNTANFSPVPGFFGDADGDATDRNDGGFEVQGTFSEAPNLTQATAELIPNGVPQTGATVNFSVFLQLDLSAGDQGIDTISMYYPNDLTGLQLVGLARASSNVGLSGNGISAYTVSSVEAGQFTVELTRAIEQTRLVRLDFQAEAPTYPIFADFFLNVNNTANFNESFVVPGPVVTNRDVTFLGFEVQPSFSFDTLADLVVSASAESLIALPLDAGGNNFNGFVEPNTQPTVSVLLKVEVDPQNVISPTAGFDVITLYAPPGFTLPSTYTVYRGTDVTSLGNTDSVLSNTLYNVNTDFQANGEIRLEFENVQGTGSQDSTLFYRVEFKPTAPDYEISGGMGIFLTNLSNPLEVQPAWTNVATAAQIYDARNAVLDTDSLHFDVFYPFVETTVNIVDDLVAEVNVVKASGNKGRTVQLSTESRYVVDLKPIVFTGSTISGFDRVGVELPFGFTDPSSTLTLQRLDQAGTFQANVAFSSTFNAESSRLILSLKDLQTSTEILGSYYRLGFKTTSFDYPAPAYFFVGVDNSNARDFFQAFPGDVDGVANSNGLDIEVLPKPVDVADLNDFFIPVVDDLVIEVTPQIATVSDNAKDFTVYVAADNVIGQRGFNRLTLILPFDFENISNVTVYSNGGDRDTVPFSKLAVGAGLSEVFRTQEDPEFGNIVRIDFTSLMGVDSDETIQVTFEADMPDYASFGEIFAVVDDKSKSFPMWSRPGDAHSSATTNESFIFVDPPQVDFNLSLLGDFKSVLVAGNALESGSITGQPIAGGASYVDIYMSLTKRAADTGIDVLEIYIPFPIDGNRLNVDDVTVSSANARTVSPDWKRLNPTKLEISKSDFSLKVKFDNALDLSLLDDEEQFLRVRLPIVAPDFSGLYYFGVRGFSFAAPGLDVFPYVAPVADTAGASMEVSVLPFVDRDFQDFAEKRPVSFIEAEAGPNFAPTSSSSQFTVASNILIGTADLGFDTIKVYLPGGYGTPGSVELSIGALPLLDPSQYSSEVSDGLLIVSLLDQSVTESTNLFLSFSVQTGDIPEFGFIEMEVYSSDRPLLSEFAGWGEVSASVGSFSDFASMEVNLYPDFENITFVDPIEELYAEVNVSGTGAAGEAIAGQAMEVTYSLNALDVGETAGGFDTVVLFMDPLFVNFPNTVSVNVTDSNGNTTQLVAGTSTGFELDTTNPGSPVIKLKENIKEAYGSNVQMEISYTIDAPDEPREYFMDFFVDNQSVPRAFFPVYGFQDLDGDPQDGNSLWVSVFPEPIVIAEELYVVDNAVAEIVSDNLSVNEGAKISLYVDVFNTSGNGFDRLGFRKDESIAFGQVTLVKDLVTDNVLVRDVEYTVTVETDRVVLRFAEVQAASGNGSYQVDFSLTAPDSPVELRFDAAVDNSALRLPVFAFDGDANGILGDRNSLNVSVLPDFTAALGDGGLVLDVENLESLFAEAVFATGKAKQGEVNTSRKVELYIKPEFNTSSANNGVNRFVIQVPTPFGKPSNVALYSGGNSVLSGSANLALLEKGNVDYSATIGDDNRITLDFSGAQRDTWKKIDYNNTASDNVYFVLTFETVLPDLPERYFLYVEADNKSLPLPRPAIWDDVNGEADDNGDAVDFGLNDNSLGLNVVPVSLTATQLLETTNASSLVAELVGATNGELGNTVSLSFAFDVGLEDVSGNIDRLRISLPSEFSNVNGLTLSRKLAASANSVRLQEITDYTAETADPTKILLKFVEGQVVDALYTVDFTVTLPGRSSIFDIAASVDNSATPKRVFATPGSTIVENGSGTLEYFVDPASFSDEDLVKNMLTTFTATATLVEGETLQVNRSGRIQVVANATFAPEDEGFDLLEISSFGLRDLSDVVIKITQNSVQRQLFELQDYLIFETPVGQFVELLAPIRTDDATLEITFSATGASDPQTALIELVAASKTLPIIRPAKLAEGGSLGISVVPEKKSVADLKRRPAKPVDGLSFDVAPASGNALASHEVELYVNAQVTLTDTVIGTGANIETIPASSGFDQIFVTMPKQFGQVSGVEIFRYTDSTFTGNAEPLQEIADYGFDVNDKNLVTIELASSANLVESGNAEGSFKVVLQTTLPAQPMTKKIRVAVDNSQDPNVVKGIQSEFSGDGIANSKVTVEPVVVDEESLAKIGTGAFVTLVYPQASGQDDLPEPGEEPYEYTLRLKVNASAETSGFDTVVIEYPDKIRNIGVNAIKKTSADNLELTQSMPLGSEGVDPDVDAQNFLLTLNFGQLQASESGNTTFAYMDIELFGKMPQKPATYHHKIFLFNSQTGADLDVDSAVITGDVGETGKLALKVEPPGLSGKYGFFGGGSGNILDTFKGAVYAWDGAAFASNIDQTTTARNILIETEPTFAGLNTQGFDYLQIDLPYGSGEPSNVVVFFQSGNGTFVYLQEFFDYQVFLTPGDLTIEFSEVVDADYMSTSGTGVFAQIIGENLEAEKLYVSFEMEMPSRLGRHFFDVFALNTDRAVASDPFFVDPFVGNPREGTEDGLLGQVSNVNRSEFFDGTRFLAITVNPAVSATPVVESAVAEIAIIGQDFVPVAATRQLRLDVAITPGSGNTYNLVEIQLPEGFNTVTGLILNENAMTLREFIDYTLDLTHPRSVGISFNTDRSAASVLDMTFTIQTPASPPELFEVGYLFGVLISDVKSGLLQTSPVFADAGDASLANSGSFKASPLAVTLNQDAAVISGTVTLDELSSGDTTGSLTLTSEDGSDTYTQSFQIAAGESSYSFVISQTTDDATSFGVAAGNYTLSVSVPQFVDTVTNIEVTGDANGAVSVEGLVIALVAETVQATLVLDDAVLGSTGVETVNMDLDFTVSQGTTLESFDFRFVADAGTTGSFQTFNVTAATMGGNALAVTGNVEAGYSVALSGVSAQSPVRITLSVEAGVGQSGLYSIVNSLNTSAGNFLASGVSDVGSAPLFNVGDLVSITLTDLPTALLGEQYLVTFADQIFVDDSIDRDQIIFSWEIDSAISASLIGDTSGQLAGTFTVTSQAGFSVNVIVSGNGFDPVKQEYLLRVYKQGFLLTSVSPAVIPTDGGTLLIKGFGFTDASAVMIGSTPISADNVTLETIVTTTGYTELLVTVPPLAQSSYTLTIEDAGEFTGIPNPFNSSSLQVAVKAPAGGLVEASVTGETASILDYDIVGITGFYQGAVGDIIEGAFGAYDPQNWRAFSYPTSGTYTEIGLSTSDSVKPGDGFWLISRVSGSMSYDAVPATGVDSYTVEIPANRWKLVSNIYEQSVVWESVTILAGTVDAPVVRTVAADRVAASPILNANLYAMDKLSSDLARPYAPSEVMASGKGYWVQNKTNESVLLQISNPAMLKPRAKAVADKPAFFKAGEDLPPAAPVTFTQSGSAASSAGGGGGCLLK